MIPATCKESVSFTDPTTGVVYKFKPKDGATDRRVVEVAFSDDNPLAQLNKLDGLVNEIVTNWSDPKAIGMPKFGIKPVSEIFNTEEKWKLLMDFWAKANMLTSEEKKTHHSSDAAL
jgi:hypothetical protein